MFAANPCVLFKNSLTAFAGPAVKLLILILKIYEKKAT